MRFADEWHWPPSLIEDEDFEYISWMSYALIEKQRKMKEINKKMADQRNRGKR